MTLGTQPAVEIETKLKSDAALKSLSELRKAIKEDLTESLSLTKVSSKDLAKELVGGLTSTLNPLALVAAGVAGVGAAFSGLISITRESISAAMEAEVIEMRVARSMQLRGQYTQESFEALKEFNDQLERTTTLDADQLLQVQGTLTSMGVLREDLKKVTLAAIGLSEEFGIDLPQATKEMGTAIVENREVLRKYGVDAKSAEEIIARFAPSAQLAAEKMELLSGVLANNKTAWGGLSEAFGSIFTQSDAIKGAIEGISGAVRGLTEILKSVQPYVTRFADGMTRVVTDSLMPGSSLISLYRSIRYGSTNEDLVFSTPIIEADKGGVKTQNRKDAIPTIYTTVDEAMVAAAKKRREAIDAEYADALWGRGKGSMYHRGKGQGIGESEDARQAELAALRDEAIALQELTQRIKDNNEARAKFDAARDRRALAGPFLDSEGNLTERFASREGEALAAELKASQALMREAQRDRSELEYFQSIIDGASETEFFMADFASNMKQHFAQVSAAAASGMAGVLGSMIETSIEGGKIDFGQMFSGLLVSVGQTALSMGLVAMAMAGVGMLFPVLAPVTGGGPAGLAAGAALAAIGASTLAVGHALGGGGKGASVPARPSAGGGGAGSFGGGPSSGFQIPRGFQPDALQTPQATVINVSFSGLMHGSERGLGRQIAQSLRAAGTLGGS